MSSSPTIVCVHGVGLWPGLFNALRFELPALHLVCPGYEDIAAVASFEEQVDFVANEVNRVGRAVIVGVSGGATLALACATRNVEGLVAAVSHEPLIGALAPQLNASVTAAGRSLAETPSKVAAIDFLRGLYGQRSWDAIPDMAKRWANDHASTVCAEVSQFSSYQPLANELAALSVPHLTTVGSESAAVRHEIGRQLSDLGSATAIVQGSGHLVLADQPSQFCSIVQDFLEGTME